MGDLIKWLISFDNVCSVSDGNGDNTSLIISVAVGVILALVVIIVIIILLLYKKRFAECVFLIQFIKIYLNFLLQKHIIICRWLSVNIYLDYNAMITL